MIYHLTIQLKQGPAKEFSLKIDEGLALSLLGPGSQIEEALINNKPLAMSLGEATLELVADLDD